MFRPQVFATQPDPAICNLSASRFFCSVLLFCSLLLVPAAEAQTLSVLYDFGSRTGDPLYPYWEGIIAQGRDGNLYSTTMDGGANGWGATFKITPTGSLKVPYSFTDPGTPEGGLTLGTDGNFYGTTQLAGANISGQIFKMTPAGTVTVLYTFTGGTDGGTPSASPIQGADGNFYGTTISGGGAGGYGTVYKITPSGTFSTLHTFSSTDGANPHAPLVLGTDNNLYGTTYLGGTSGDGIVFRISTSGSYTVLYNFDGTHGANPNGPLAQGSDGFFYGTTANGGASSSGVVFKLVGGGKISVLHSLNGTSEGSQPFAGLLQATDGNFYGSASGGGSTSCSGGCGTLFKIALPSTFSVIYTFGTSAAGPNVTLIQHTNGLLYGDTENGGGCSSPGCGAFFSLNLGLKPFVSLVYTSGKVGRTVEILGQGFTGTTAVSFNGTAATFKVLSNSYLTATVPTGATTGFVTVTTPSATLTSNKKFRVIP